LKVFPHIYTQRQQDPGWSVVQAATLFSEGMRRKRGSLIIYAALELRLAIEQLFFTIIAIGQGELNPETLVKLRKKDKLFRFLEEVSPKYSLRCRFANVLSPFLEFPQIAEWDVRSLRRYYTELSEMCHSQLIIRDFEDDPLEWNKRIALLKEVYQFLETGMKKGTGVLKLQDKNPVLADLWEKFSNGQIDAEELRNRLAIIRQGHKRWGVTS
jgi:hypothetical protein